MKRGGLGLFGCAVLAWLSPAFADDAPGGISLDAGQLGRGHPPAALEATRVAPRAPRMPAVLAAGKPQLETLYTQVLAAFEQGLEKHGMPRHDVAIAAAMYISGAYGAYHGAEVADAAFAALVTQLRNAIAATPAFTRASMAQKQDMYEALAITGTMIAVSAQQRPGDASVRSQAKTSLEGFLRAGADSIQITERGLILAGASAGAAVASPPAASPPPPPTAPPPPPSGALSPKGVTALLWKTELRYEAFPANSMVMHEDSYLLLADGTCTDRVPATVDGFDPAAERAAHPNRWCRWRKHGVAYEVAFGAGGKWLAVSGATVLRPAKHGEHLAGAWSRSKTTTVGTGGAWTGTTLVLTAAGRFELARAGHFTTNSSLNPPRGEVVASGTSDNRGDTGGTYVLDGIGIELRFDGGRIERKTFGISTDGDHAFVRFGGDMMPKKK